MTSVECRDLGRMEYEACRAYQRELFEELLARKAAKAVGYGATHERAGWLLWVEHPPVYTLGKSGRAENLLVTEERLRSLGAAFHRIDRGGDITFHGPGQLVGYPILDLDRLGMGLRAYIDSLEGAVIEVAAELGIRAGRVPGASGVWVGGTKEDERPARKLCAVGVRASRGVTMHGLALNVSTDLGWFDHINPCGFADRGVTSVERELGYPVDMNEVKALMKSALSKRWNAKI